MIASATAAMCSLAVAGRSDASTIIEYQGTTLACLGAACTDPDFDSTVTIVEGITFEGTDFGLGTTDLSGAASFSLGEFLRDGTNFDDPFELDFTLKVTFLVPTAIDGGQSTVITAELTGTLAGKGNSFLAMNFDNTWFDITYSNAEGEGEFQFGIPTDPEGMNKNDSSRLVMGAIQNALFTPFDNGDVDPVPTVPEPTTMVLLGAGLSAVAMRLRRRRAKSD